MLPPSYLFPSTPPWHHICSDWGGLCEVSVNGFHAYTKTWTNCTLSTQHLERTKMSLRHPYWIQKNTLTKLATEAFLPFTVPAPPSPNSFKYIIFFIFIPKAKGSSRAVSTGMDQWLSGGWLTSSVNWSGWWHQHLPYTPTLAAPSQINTPTTQRFPLTQSQPSPT